MAKKTTTPGENEPLVSGQVIGFVRHDGKAYRDCPATFPQSAALRLVELGRFIVEGPTREPEPVPVVVPVPEPTPPPDPEPDIDGRS